MRLEPQTLAKGGIIVLVLAVAAVMAVPAALDGHGDIAFGAVFLAVCILWAVDKLF